ncbi:MAG TPA: nucleotide exchange factor GrpE [Planctomycetota bacterium]|nr:nucleotide exchange factor GrpE [Planctomycetota bacterium]
MITPEFQGEMESLLNALRQWMVEMESLPAEPGTEGPMAVTAPDEVLNADLLSVVRELTALRGEVRVETRVAKASREKMDEAARAFETGVGEAEEALREAALAMETGARRALEPLLRDRDRLRDQLERVRDEPLRAGQEALLDVVESLQRGRQATAEVRGRLGWRGWFLPREVLAGLLEGYEMAVKRVERSLAAMGVTEVACLGQPFDPNRMRAVETEVREDVPPGQVVEILRPGYVRGETVLRFADVRAAVAANTPRTQREEHAAGRGKEES